MAVLPPPTTFKQQLVITGGIVLLVLAIGFAGLSAFTYLEFGTTTFSWDYDSRTSYFLSSHLGRIELAVQHAPPTTNTSIGRVALDRPVNVTYLGRVGGSDVGLTAAEASKTPYGRWFGFDPHELKHESLGFGWTSSQILRMMAVPNWFFALASCSLGVAILYASKRPHRLLRKHQCHSCGYDLRATPDRCPECGTVPRTDLAT